MNQIGMYAYCGFLAAADERFDAIKNAGFDLTAVWCGEDFATGSGMSEYEQAKFLKESALSVAYGHMPRRLAPYLSNKFYGAKDAVKMHKVWAKNAKDQGINMVVAHLPQVTPAVIDNVAQIVEFCDGYGVKFAVENLNGDAPFDELFAEVKGVGFCYDTCHAMMFGDDEGKMAEKYAANLVCTHISDGDGKSDGHLLPGDGGFNFRKFAKLLKDIGYKGDYICESLQTPKYTDISAFLTDAKKKMEDIFIL